MKLYGIPRSVAQSTRRLFAGTLGDVLWKLFILGLLVLVGIALLSMGAVGGVIGGILLGTLLADDVRAFISDLWNRRWARIETPL